MTIQTYRKTVFHTYIIPHFTGIVQENVHKNLKISDAKAGKLGHFYKRYFQFVEETGRRAETFSDNAKQDEKTDLCEQRGRRGLMKIYR